MMRVFFTLALMGLCVVSFADANRKLVSDKKAKNYALLVSASYGLPGLDKDISIIKSILDHETFNIHYEHIQEDGATKEAVVEKIKETVKEVDASGSFTFYFTGHGTRGSILLADDELLSATEIREAIAESRQGKPMERINLLFDSCYSGSLLDPLKERGLSFGTSQNFADSVFSVMRQGRGSYYNKLFVFASSSEDEVSYAGEEGSRFTVSLKNAFQDSIKNKYEMEQWVARTRMLTEDQRPEARFMPDSLRFEKVVE